MTVPATITRDQLIAVAQQVADALGLDGDVTTIRSIEIDRDGIHLSRFRQNADGVRYLGHGQEAATETYSIGVDDEPGWRTP